MSELQVTAPVEIHGAELELVITFDYQPEEKMVIRQDPNDSYPGWPEEITLNTITYNKPDDMGALLDVIPKELEETVWDLRDEWEAA